MTKISCRSAEVSALLTARSMRAKNGSANTFAFSSPTMRAIEPARRHAGDLAARLRT
jgi:hypothetical protein